MAWGGKHSRMTMKQRKHFLRSSNRALSRVDPAGGIPRVVLKALAAARLPSDPTVIEAKLQELLLKHNGG
jgi:hypothetical protein